MDHNINDNEKSMLISYLLDFYGEVLSDKQYEAVNLYYNEDFSLSEIAEQTNITRHGVRDRIVKSVNILMEMESKLGLAERFNNVKNIIDSMIIKLENVKNNYDVAEIDDIIESAKSLLD